MTTTYPNYTIIMDKLKRLYNKAKEAIKGDKVTCPSCGSKFTKTHYQQVFCKSKGGTVCKDYYWNNVTPDKKNNTTRISPNNAKYRQTNIYNYGK